MADKTGRLLGSLLGVFLLCLTNTAAATTQVSTLAGVGLGDGNVVPNCTFYAPADICGDGTYFYIADTANHLIRRIEISSGSIATVAGTAGQAGYQDNCLAASSKFNSPKGIAKDPGSNWLYIADTNNHVIRNLDLTGQIIYFYAGTPGSSGSTDGALSTAKFSSPGDVVADATGNTLFVADTGNHRIRYINKSLGLTGIVAGTTQGYLDGTGTAARFDAPAGLARSGNVLYVADTNNQVLRKIDLTTNQVTTFSGWPESAGSADGNSYTARYCYPRGLEVNGGNIYCSDAYNHTIRLVNSSNGSASTLAGTAGNTGNADGSGAAAQFNRPGGLACDGTYLYVADTNNDAVRRVTLAGAGVFTWAGGLGDGRSLPNCSFRSLCDVCADSSGDFYVADTENNVIRKISSGGGAETIAGRAGVGGSSDGAGDAARFKSPKSLALSADGSKLYVADADNHTIRQISLATSMVTTLAGSPASSGSIDGIGSAARLNYPTGLAAAPNGQALYIADTFNHTIRRLDLSTLALTTPFGAAGSQGYADASGASARFSFPAGLEIDAGGNTLLVADSGNHAVRSIDLAAGGVTSLLGTSSQLGAPQGLALGAGFLFVSDASLNQIFICDPARGTKLTLAGQGTAGDADGDYAAATFQFPQGLAYSQNALLAADTLNHKLRRVDNLMEIRDLGLQPVLSNIFVAAEKNQWVLHLEPVVSGQDTLTGLTVKNSLGTAVNADDIAAVKLWFQDQGGDFSSDRAVLLATLEPYQDNRTWKTPSPLSQVLRQGDGLYVTVDVSSVPMAARITQFGVPAGGLLCSSGSWPAVATDNPFYQTLAPAGMTFAVYCESLMPKTAVLGQTRVPVMKLRFTNLLRYEFPVNTLNFTCENRNAAAIPANSALASLSVYDEAGNLRGQQAAAGGSEITVALSPSVAVPSGQAALLVMYADIHPQASADNWQLSLSSALSINNGTIDAVAEQGTANPDNQFPMRSEFVHLEAADLFAAYSNYPNPFEPPLQTTTVKYFLPRPGKVSLSLWTLTEELVTTLLDQEQQAAGLYTTVWNGKNGQGNLVVSGVYLCRLWIRFDDGSTQCLTRKIAVIR